MKCPICNKDKVLLHKGLMNLYDCWEEAGLISKANGKVNE